MSHKTKNAVTFFTNRYRLSFLSASSPQIFSHFMNTKLSSISLSGSLFVGLPVGSLVGLFVSNGCSEEYSILFQRCSICQRDTQAPKSQDVVLNRPY